MRSMISYTKAAMERAMKVQEVILRAMAKKITWWQAAEIIGSATGRCGVGGSAMRSLVSGDCLIGGEGSLAEGSDGAWSGSGAVSREVLRSERAALSREAEGSTRSLSYSWVKGVLQGAGLMARGRKRGLHRKRRPRRPLPGMLLHIDGSEHRWFQDERWYDLLVILDDATSEIYYAQLVERNRR